MKRPTVTKGEFVAALYEPRDELLDVAAEALRDRAAAVKAQREERAQQAAQQDEQPDDGRTRVLSADEAARAGGSAAWGAAGRYARGETLERSTSGGCVYFRWLDRDGRVLG